MSQKIDNTNSPINNQLNISENHGPIHIKSTTRFSKRFEKLNS